MKANPGDRIRLLAMPDDPCPLPVGATGTIKHIWPQPPRGGMPDTAWAQYWIDWDAPHERRSLMLCSPPDQFEVIGHADHVSP